MSLGKFAPGVMAGWLLTLCFSMGRLEDQLDRFTAVMRGSLVPTHSKGFLAFGGSRIELVPPDAEAGTSVVSLRPLIHADRQQPHVVIYQKSREDSVEWKLSNDIV